jgi:hypothetical protein
MYLRRSNAAPDFFSSQLYLQNQHSEHEDDRENSGSLRLSEVEDWF